MYVLVCVCVWACLLVRADGYCRCSVAKFRLSSDEHDKQHEMNIYL